MASATRISPEALVLHVALSGFEARQSADEVKTDPELTCVECGAVVCDIEHGDTLATLVATAIDHECSD